MSDVSIVRYMSDHEKAWNDFVASSKNSTFLFNRSYMDYHSARFKDHSVLVNLRDKPVAIFPANESYDTIHSHAGLSYGGLVLSPDVKLPDVLKCFYHVVHYYHQKSFKKIDYKSFPSYLCSQPSNEDQYALHLLEAKLLRRQLSSVLVQSNSRRPTTDPDQKDLKIKVVQDPTEFWQQVLVPNLSDRFGTSPVHTVDEMKLLMSRFPQNIRLYEIRDDELLAGALLYVSYDAVHTQYLSASPKGKEIDALRILIQHLIDNDFADKSIFSFGTSDDGQGGLNQGLLNWKERFGARSFVLDRYEIDTSRYKLLEQYE